LWSFGDNIKGGLGSGDLRNFNRPHRLTFFKNKRVIDVACGD